MDTFKSQTWDFACVLERAKGSSNKNETNKTHLCECPLSQCGEMKEFHRENEQLKAEEQQDTKDRMIRSSTRRRERIVLY